MNWHSIHITPPYLSRHEAKSVQVVVKADLNADSHQPTRDEKYGD